MKAMKKHNDCGLLFFVLLKMHKLNKFDALYVPPGTVHCYLKGFAVEVMKSSDNVLRCGLTQKRIDKEELMRIMNFGSGVLYNAFTEFHSDDFDVKLIKSNFKAKKG